MNLQLAKKVRLLIGPTLALALAPSAFAGTETGVLSGDLTDIFEKGGLLMYPIVGLSVIGLAFAFERMVALRRGILAPKDLMARVRQAARAHDAEAVGRELGSDGAPLARILRAGLARQPLGSQEMERAMESAGALEVARLRRNVRILAVLATVEPLLGLLGTVLGMIQTFNQLHGTSPAERVEKLAPGIGQALYTTAAGLCVAIPFVLLFHWLSGRINRAVEEWNDCGGDLALGLSTTAGKGTGEAA